MKRSRIKKLSPTIVKAKAARRVGSHAGYTESAPRVLRNGWVELDGARQADAWLAYGRALT